MVDKTCKFSPEWLERSVKFGEINIKLDKIFAKHNDFQVKCLVCVTTVSIKHKGFAGLTQHMETDKHKKQMKLKCDQTQKKIKFNAIPEAVPSCSTSKTATNQAVQLFAPKDKTTRAELVLLLNGLSNNCSLKSFDNLSNVLKCGIDDSQILQAFTLNRTKASYVLNFALGPYFRNQLLRDIDKQLYFTLHKQHKRSK